MICKYKLAHRVGQRVFVGPHITKFDQHHICSFTFTESCSLRFYTYLLLCNHWQKWNTKQIHDLFQKLFRKQI